MADADSFAAGIQDRPGRSVRPDEGSPTQQERIPIIFVGRRATAEEMQLLFGEEHTTDGSVAGDSESAYVDYKDTIDLTVLTNQKAALRLMRCEPPRVALVEVDARPDSRVRFCETLHRRLPTLAIFAVGRKRPQGKFEFDDFLELPLTRERVFFAINRIRNQFASHVVQRGPFRLNVATRTVFAPNGSRHVTPKQCALLKMLMIRSNEVVSRKDIMASIWETSYMEDTRTLDVHIRWVRECIEPDPSNPIYLLTVRGQGYQLRVPESAVRD